MNQCLLWWTNYFIISNNACLCKAYITLYVPLTPITTHDFKQNYTVLL